MQSECKNFLKAIKYSYGYTSKKMAEVFKISLSDYLKMESNGLDEMRIRDCKILLVHFSINPLELLNLLDPNYDPL